MVKDSYTSAFEHVTHLFLTGPYIKSEYANKNTDGSPSVPFYIYYSL